MINLLKYHKSNPPSLSAEFNSVNGYDAEVFAASRLLSSICGELSWSSRTEDGRQIDLLCSYDHPWFNTTNKNRIIFLVQVKSGDSYGKKTNTGYLLRSAAIKSALKLSNNICLIWIDSINNEAFWSYIHPNSLIKSHNYGNNHILNPAFRFDLARCQSRFLPIDEGGKGIIIKELEGDLTLKRKLSLEKYRALANVNVINPNVGKVEFTRTGWRHMFRKNRSAIYKETSLNLIPYLSLLLSQKASTVVSNKIKHETIANYEYRNIEYLLKYKNTKIYCKESKETLITECVIRIIESIKWPKNWSSNVLNTQLIERKVTLLSAYYKKEGASPRN